MERTRFAKILLGEQIDVLKKICSSKDIFYSFLDDLRIAYSQGSFPPLVLKPHLQASFTGIGKCDCFAFVPNALFEILEARLGKLNYTYRQLSETVKTSNEKHGKVSQNVNYRTHYNLSNTIQRSIIIRKVGKAATIFGSRSDF